MNTFGEIFRITDFGESHGAAIGGVIDGMPAGIDYDADFLASEMARRRPGTSPLVTARQETDAIEVLSGIFEGKTTGTPIGFIIRNIDQHSADYDNMRHIFRPSHADFTYTAKYGIRDHRGGGRSSARETAVRVAAGAFAKMALRKLGIEIRAVADSIGTVKRQAGQSAPITDAMFAEIARAKSEGDTIGGVISCRITGCPAGLGQPVFGKLHARLGAAMLSINACHGFEYGSGFAGTAMRGSEAVDNWMPYPADERGIRTTTNNSGGIQGGISNGEPIEMRVAFKPVATLLQDVETVNDIGEAATLHARGRHDPCVVPRALVIVEAMAAVTILDAVLLNQTTRLHG